MLNPKKVAFPAVFGFVLFFLVSLIFTHKILPALLRGFVFGLVFGALFFAIDFVFSKFLDADTGAEPSTTKNSQSRSGSTIDITISDEELTDDGQVLHFPVSRNKFALSAEDKKEVSIKGEAAPSTPPPAADLPPVNVSSTPSSSATTETSAPSAKTEQKATAPAPEAEVFKPISLGRATDSSAGATSASTAVSEKDEIESLPEIADFVQTGGAPSSNENVILDSDFASEGTKPSSSEKKLFADGSRASDHDTATLARAIQTVLKRDE